MSDENHVSNVWAPLLPVAMVGTDRHASALPTWPGAMGQLVAQVSSEGKQPATAVLRAAAVLATCDLAAAQGSTWPGPLPAPAVDDALPALEEGAVTPLLFWALHEGPTRLQHEVLTTLAQRPRRLPHALLPQALELGRRSLALRPVLAPVLGSRGVWLPPASMTNRCGWQAASTSAAPSCAKSVWPTRRRRAAGWRSLWTNCQPKSALTW
jgi:hypothetical protein